MGFGEHLLRRGEGEGVGEVFMRVGCLGDKVRGGGGAGSRKPGVVWGRRWCCVDCFV
jgi:hypothetical protein